MYCRILRNAASVALLLAFAACKDGTGPDAKDTSEAQVLITAVASEHAWVTEGGEELLQCSVNLSATATGRAAATAVWGGAVFRWHAGPNGAVADSVVMSADEVRESWGGINLTVGQRLESGWYFRAGVPFGISADYHYGADATRIDRKASWRVNCGPQLPPEGAPAPTLTASLTTPRSDVGPGDVLEITYTASSPVGLLETVVEISGAHDTQIRQRERLATSTTRTARFTVPAMVLLGQPLRVRVHAVDAALQTSTQELPATSPVVDRTPPQVTNIGMVHGQHTIAGYLPGPYPVGDTLYVTVGAADTYGLSTVGAELVGPGGTVRDSITVSARNTVEHRFVLPIPAQWVGARGQVRVFARDTHGNRTEGASEPNSFHFFPTRDHPVRSAIIPGVHYDAVLDTRRGRAYLVTKKPNRLVVVSLASLTEEASLNLSGSESLALTPGGDSLLVLLPAENAVAVIDPDRPTVIAGRIPLQTGGARANSIRVAANGRVLITTSNSQTEVLGVLELNLADGSHRFRTDAGQGRGTSTTLAASLDAGRLLVQAGCTQVYVSALDRFEPCKGSLDASIPSMDATGSRVAHGLSVSDGDLNLLLRWSDPFGTSYGRASGLMPDGQHAYTSTSRGWFKVHAATGRFMERVRVPGPVHRFLVPKSSEFLLGLGYHESGGGSTQLVWVDLR